MITALLLTQFIGVPCAFLFGMVASRIGAERRCSSGLRVYVLITVLGYFMTTADAFLCAGRAGRHGAGRHAGAQPIAVREHDPEAQVVGVLRVLQRVRALRGRARSGDLRLGRRAQRIGARRAILAVGAFFVVGAAMLTFVDVDRGRPGGARRRSRARAPRPSVATLMACRLRFPSSAPRAGDHGGLLPGRAIRCGSGQRPGPAAAESCQRPARSRGDLGHGVAGRALPRQVDAVRRGVRADPEGCPRDSGVPPPGPGSRSGEERRDLRRGSECIRRRRRGVRFSGRDQSFHRQAGAAQDRRRQDGDRRRAGWGPRGDGRGGSELRSQDRVPVAGHRALWPAVHGRGSRGR